MPFTRKNVGGPARSFVMGELRALAGWHQWRVANGIAPNDNSRDTIERAAEHFGYDVDARIKHFFDNVCPSTMVTAPASPAPATLGADVDIEAATEDDAIMANDGRQDEAGEAGEAGETDSFEGKDAEALIAEALAPLAPHMTAFMQGELPKLIRPAFEAATRGPRVIRETVALVTGENGQITASVPDAKVVEWISPAKAFAGLTTRGGSLVNGRLPKCDYMLAPKLDADYRWNADILGKLASCDMEGDNAWVYGPAGTGKTEGARAYAATLRRPFIRIAINRGTDEVSLTGQWMLSKNGGMVWQDGKLSAAFRVPYAVILVDEVTLMRPGALALFQTALDTRELFLDNGERLQAAQGVFIIAADNTAGVGDPSGRYVDTAPMNIAFLDRFALKIQFEYLTEAEEAKMLHNRTGVDLGAARIMTHFVALTRKDCEAGKLTAGLGPRRVMAWAKHAKHLGSKAAFENAILNGTAPEDIEALAMLVQTSLESSHAEIDRLIQGLPAPAPSAAPAPAPSATGAKFPDEEV